MLLLLRRHPSVVTGLLLLLPLRCRPSLLLLLTLPAFAQHLISLFSFVEMDDLLRRFKKATSNRSVTLDSLEKNKDYPVLKAQRVQAKYGVSIFLTVKDCKCSACLSP